jgi:hypothetical protein
LKRVPTGSQTINEITLQDRLYSTESPGQPEKDLRRSPKLALFLSSWFGVEDATRHLRGVSTIDGDPPRLPRSAISAVKRGTRYGGDEVGKKAKTKVVEQWRTSCAGLAITS